MINPILLRQFGDPVFLAGELTKLLRPVKTFEEDKYESLHLHNEILRKVYSMIGVNDVELRFELARLIYRIGAKNAQKEEETTRRTVGQGHTRRTVTA